MTLDAQFPRPLGRNGQLVSLVPVLSTHIDTCQIWLCPWALWLQSTQGWNPVPRAMAFLMSLRAYSWLFGLIPKLARACRRLTLYLRFRAAWKYGISLRTDFEHDPCLFHSCTQNFLPMSGHVTDGHSFRSLSCIGLICIHKIHTLR